MTEFVRLPSRIVNLAQIRQITFEHCDATLHWQNGDKAILADMDAAILLEYLEQRHKVKTTSIANQIFNTKAERWFRKEVAPDELA